MNAVATLSAPSQLPVSAEHASFDLVQRRAKAMASSTLVPEAYRNNLPNVLIALELADRIGASPMQIMQNLHIIQGRPSLSSSFLIATVNACGRFTPLRFEVVGGDDPSKDTYRVRAFAEDKASGEACRGAWITWPMVKAEKWSTKPGSKWLTMPEQMFMYRAAAFWARVYAPEVSQGIHTVEEVRDVWGGDAAIVPAPTTTANLRQLESQLRGDPAEPAPEPTHTDDLPPIVAAQDVHDRLAAANDVDALHDAAADIALVADDEARASLTAFYAERGQALSE